MNTTDAGRLGEAKVIARLAELGWYPFSDLSGKCPVDLLAWKDDQVVRIQVKTCDYRPNGSSYAVQIGSTRPNRTGNKIHKFDSSKVDVLAVYLVTDDTVCFIDSSKINTGRVLTLQVKRNRRDVLFVDDLLEL